MGGHSLPLTKIKLANFFCKVGQWLETETEIPISRTSLKGYCHYQKANPNCNLLQAVKKLKVQNQKHFTKPISQPERKKKEVIYKEDGAFYKMTSEHLNKVAKITLFFLAQAPKRCRHDTWRNTW